MIKYRIYLFSALLLIILGTLAGCKYNANNTDNTAPPSVEAPVAESPQAAPPVVDNQSPENPDPTPVSTGADTFSWWFTRNQQHQIPATNRDTAQLLAQNNAFYVLPNNDKNIYLTFDCGYELGYTAKILDILDRQHIKAAFFITGHYIQSQPDLVKRMQTSGQLVCNHTWNHPDLTTVSQDKFNQEIMSLDQKFSELTGSPMSPYLRPPMGNYSATSLRWAQELGYATVFWSMALQDWDPNKQPGAESVHKSILDNIHPGAVILMHAVSQSDTEALEQIIIDLQAQGYVFSTFNT